MASRSLIMALAKVIAAAAWADNHVSNEEINSLKDLLFQLPQARLDQGLQLTGKEWARLEMYLESPVDEAERTRLIAELQNELNTPADKQIVKDALKQLVETDGAVTEAEKQIINEVNEALEQVDVGLIAQLGRLIGGAVDRRTAAVAHAPNREQFFADFIKNKVFYEVRRRLNLGEAELEIPEGDLRKLSLAGGLMAKVAHVDHKVTDKEFDAIANALQTHWDVDRQTAVFITEVATSEVAKKLDHYRTVRQFSTRTTRTERVHFLDVLFAVAAADGYATYDEIEEIRAIGKGMLLTHPQFIQAKLKLPRERRAT